MTHVHRCIPAPLNYELHSKTVCPWSKMQPAATCCEADDDIISQAAGLGPWPCTPFRWLPTLTWLGKGQGVPPWP